MSVPKGRYQTANATIIFEQLDTGLKMVAISVQFSNTDESVKIERQSIHHLRSFEMNLLHTETISTAKEFCTVLRSTEKNNCAS